MQALGQEIQGKGTKKSWRLRLCVCAIVVCLTVFAFSSAVSAETGLIPSYMYYRTNGNAAFDISWTKATSSTDYSTFSVGWFNPPSSGEYGMIEMAIQYEGLTAGYTYFNSVILSSDNDNLNFAIMDKSRFYMNFWHNWPVQLPGDDTAMWGEQYDFAPYALGSSNNRFYVEPIVATGKYAQTVFVYDYAYDDLKTTVSPTLSFALFEYKGLLEGTDAYYLQQIVQKLGESGSSGEQIQGALDTIVTLLQQGNATMLDIYTAVQLSNDYLKAIYEFLTEEMPELEGDTQGAQDAFDKEDELIGDAGTALGDIVIGNPIDIIGNEGYGNIVQMLNLPMQFFGVIVTTVAGILVMRLVLHRA